jgi:hypothetical protein
MKIPKPVEFIYYVAVGALVGYAVFGPYGYPGWGALFLGSVMFAFETSELLKGDTVIGEAWRARKHESFWKRLTLEWKYRRQDENICCCGAYIGQGGEICYHGGCRSQKEYVITESLKK